MSARALAASLAVLLLLLTGCSPPPAYPLPAPPLSGADLQGRPRDLAALEGSLVIVPVWASWCGPCRDEVPVLQDAVERWGEQDVEVLGINMRDDDDSARRFLDELGGTYGSVVDPRGTVAVGWGVTTLPVTFLVDRQGQVVDKHLGVVTQEWIDQAVSARVGGADPTALPAPSRAARPASASASASASSTTQHPDVLR